MVINMMYRKCPLIGYIEEEICFDINMVADEMAPERTISKEVIKIKNYKEICKNCKYHDND